jgi:hypothetical protein
VDSATWRERVVAFVGREPPVKELGIKGREARVCVRWLCEEFQECPQDADDTTVTLYTKALVWHMFATVLLPYGMGYFASWMYIPTLSDWNEVGTYLYRQLCDACRHRARNSGVGAASISCT